MSKISEAAERSGRQAGDVTLVAVTKTRSEEDVLQALQCGITDIGENYVQEALSKFESIGNQAKWHFIGHLQRNKVKQTLKFADLIHSVDSIGLASEIGKRSIEAEKQTSILLEINLTGEDAKTGTPLHQALQFIEETGNISGIKVCGLMGMAQLTNDPEETRMHFRQLKALFDMLPKEQQIHLSMGMTQDFEIAIEEGSNMVRIGTAIFGSRD
jgi:pyridoxal phosphate enzyme (YggS family)